MALDKTCVAKGCGGIACYGFGLPSKGLMRFACRHHRHMIWPAVVPPAAVASGEGRASRLEARPSLTDGQALLL